MEKNIFIGVQHFKPYKKEISDELILMLETFIWFWLTRILYFQSKVLFKIRLLFLFVIFDKDNGYAV